ncbi:isochorismatase family protein [Deinococcus deserti]|uniref:nicotinamidase n=1 Tax=Deinococcus deserti (strain DSM 17065 / CIP 109153 / LMG 22923 / VCD115) TaxID=546414 RepID=C1CWQ2_DEIDV|nr:isochorismatase family protein [Deinococcus deserti]ACO46619.1 putative pyrazinamidase/nicotinamidase [Deinococcus deserti VCD115]
MNLSLQRVGWIVDVQNDFMRPADQGGRLYVHNLFDGGQDPGAVQIVPALIRATEWMRAHCDALVYTGDWHHIGDAEIDPMAPDAARGTYPPHCMGLSSDAREREGAEIISEIRPENPLILQRDATGPDAREIARQAVAEQRPVFVQKSRFSVFEGNAAADAFVRALREQLGGAIEVYVVGVARDVCVKGAVEGLLAQERRIPVTVITDATWGLGLEQADESYARWLEAGAALISTEGLQVRSSSAS